MNHKIYDRLFTKVYPLLINKANRKGHDQSEVNQITCWLTGYSETELQALLKSDKTYGDFFLEAPCLNPKRTLIKGVICGVRVEDIKEPLMQEICYLDKLDDELAKGKNLMIITRRM